jgi:hypothetical protein
VNDSPNTGPVAATWYEIDVGDGLDAVWSTWFDDLRVTPLDDGGTRLAGPIRDDAALHGLLTKVGDLGLKLISVRRIEPPGEPKADRRHA